MASTKAPFFQPAINIWIIGDKNAITCAFKAISQRNNVDSDTLTLPDGKIINIRMQSIKPGLVPTKPTEEIIVICPDKAADISRFAERIEIPKFSLKKNQCLIVAIPSNADDRLMCAALKFIENKAANIAFIDAKHFLRNVLTMYDRNYQVDKEILRVLMSSIHDGTKRIAVDLVNTIMEFLYTTLEWSKLPVPELKHP